MNVDTIGHDGVQLFVDAGRPVDDRLVAALVREVLVEKISSMIWSRGFNTAKKAPVAVQTEIFHTGRVSEAAGTIDDTVYERQEALQVIHPLIPIPQSTPEPSISDSHASQTSLPSTPRSLPAAAVEIRGSRDDRLVKDEKDWSDKEDVSFPTYEGMSISESQNADDLPMSLEEKHDVHTPSSTPVRSPLATMRTSSRTSTSEPSILPVTESKEILVDLELATAHPRPSSATPAPEEPEDVIESEPLESHELATLNEM